MLIRTIKVIIVFGLLSLLVGPMIGFGCFAIEGFRYGYLGCIFVGFAVGFAVGFFLIAIATIIQYIVLGQPNPTYYFKNNHENKENYVE